MVGLEAIHSHIGPWSTYDVVAGLPNAVAIVIQLSTNRIQTAWSRAEPRMSSQQADISSAGQLARRTQKPQLPTSRRLCSWYARDVPRHRGQFRLQGSVRDTMVQQRWLVEFFTVCIRCDIQVDSNFWLSCNPGKGRERRVAKDAAAA